MKFAWIVLLLLFCPLVASAQDASSLSETERESLGRLFTEAREAYDAKDYPTSIARLEAAYRIFPEPNILYRIAEMHGGELRAASPGVGRGSTFTLVLPVEARNGP